MEGLDHSVTRWLNKRKQRKSREKNSKEKRFRLGEERVAPTLVILEEIKCDKTTPTDEKMSKIESEYFPDRQQMVDKWWVRLSKLKYFSVSRID